MGIILGANQYGKAEIRVVSIDRDTPRHEIHDLSVTTTLQGDFAAAHESGDQSNVLPTDSQKNTVFAFARERGVDQIEDFALDLARHFAETVPAVISARVAIDSYAWDRVGADQTNAAGGSGHDHSFVRRGQDVRTTVTVGVTGHGPGAWVVSGIKDLVILKSTGSEFRGFFKDRYTTLAETDERILATSLVARWRYGEPAADWAKAHAGIRATILGAFAGPHSRALQQTLQAMGTRPDPGTRADRLGHRRRAAARRRRGVLRDADHGAGRPAAPWPRARWARRRSATAAHWAATWARRRPPVTRCHDRRD